MFKHTREPGGRPTYLMAGIASVLLALWLLPLGPAWAPASLAFGVAGIAFIGVWWRRRRSERYDLRRLMDPPPPDDEPYEDTVPEESAPYCGWCDEAYPPGTRRCRECGREL